MFIPFKISPGLPLLKQIAADIEHVFVKLPLVTFVISNLTRLMAVFGMKVRFEAKVTRVFLSLLAASRLTLFFAKTNFKKNLWNQGTNSNTTNVNLS